MRKHLFRWVEDLKEDILLNEKTVRIYNENGEIYSNHKVEKYRVAKGEFKDYEYYLFRHRDGRSVMNYTPEDYYNLSEHVDISFDYTIFMKYEVDGHRDNRIFPVSSDYRLKSKCIDVKF